MSKKAQCVFGFGQGADTAAVLTNHSKYVTIITDEPYFSRHSRSYPLARHRKGSRPMHSTTFTYEISPQQTSYISCMKANFSGQKDLLPSRRPAANPSQHTSQFNIGISPKHELNTHSRRTYIKHQTSPAGEIHEDNIRWKSQMAGNDMVQSIRQQGCQEMSFSTTYHKVHDLHGRQKGPEAERCPTTKRSYNVITGEPIWSQPLSDFRIRTGNKVLKAMRQKDEGQLILG